MLLNLHLSILLILITRSLSPSAAMLSQPSSQSLLIVFLPSNTIYYPAWKLLDHHCQHTPRGVFWGSAGLLGSATQLCEFACAPNVCLLQFGSQGVRVLPSTRRERDTDGSTPTILLCTVTPYKNTDTPCFWLPWCVSCLNMSFPKWILKMAPISSPLWLCLFWCADPMNR